MYSLALIIFVVSEKRAFEHRNFKNINFVEDLPMIIPGQLGFNCPSGFREEAF
jgi:hypothetical protein